MEEKKYNYRSYIKEEANKAKEEEAQKNWKRNIIGVAVSSYYPSCLEYVFRTICPY